MLKSKCTIVGSSCSAAERLTYGHTSVKGHGNEKDHFRTSNIMALKDLSYKDPKGDDFLLSKKITDYLRCCINIRSIMERLANRKYMGRCK